MKPMRYLIASTSPSAVWVDPRSFRDRVDATYYSADYFKLDDIAAEFNERSIRPLGKLLDKPKRVLYMKTDTFDEQTPELTRLPFISGVDIDGSTATINWANTKFVDAWMADRYPNGILQPNSLLIKVKGPHQLATFVERPMCTALVSGTCVISGVRDCDPFYLVAYLTSSYAESWRTRLRQNITVEFTPYEELAQIPIVYPDEKIQKAIGNKLRKAERLRQIAGSQWLSANRELEQSIGIDLSKEKFSGFTTNDIQAEDYYCHSLSPAIAVADVDDELGAQYFHPRRMHARRIASQTGSWDTLGNLTAKVNRGAGSRPGFLGLDAIDSFTGIINLSSESDGGETTCSNFVAEDLLFSRLRPYLNKVAIWPTQQGPGKGSGELLVYRSQSIDPYYLFLIAKSPLGLNQVIDVTAGSTHPRVDVEVVDEIRVPRLHEAVEKRIGSKVRCAHSHWYQAQGLVPSAKMDIEALLTGTLDEGSLLREGNEISSWLDSNSLPAQKLEAKLCQ
jgi:type I restriction enzyme, S subunit